MKLSVSLPDEDVRFLDQFAEREGIGSRSAAVQTAVRLLRSSQLGPGYEQAWAEWADSADAEVWEAAAGDGLR
ncbi:MAG: ribbon-helix-helix protein, CopG family [Actinobacteria bacterium]|nr:ribbon-helix-helix protein, CopG family [Actinomycetota bacterium]